MALALSNRSSQTNWIGTAICRLSVYFNFTRKNFRKEEGYIGTFVTFKFVLNDWKQTTVTFFLKEILMHSWRYYPCFDLDRIKTLNFPFKFQWNKDILGATGIVSCT